LPVERYRFCASSAIYLERRLGTLQASLNGQNPAAVKYALSLFGLMLADTRLPLVELDEPAKAAVARALAAMAEEDLVGAAEA
jgi:4-hydroxy-tetrahydrodipicolinate synthase